MKRTLPALAGLALLLSLGACSSGTDGLTGSAVKTYNLTYDAIRIQRQKKNDELQAVVITYVRAASTPNEEFPVIVVVNAPVPTGEQIDFMPPKGNIYREVDDGSTFPDPITATIRFDSLDEVGGSASGKFNVTFTEDTGGVQHTLNGEFGGDVTLRSAN
ncbi:MAG: hypothetical protein KC503_36345 [Myxococcales bacterium]|nr:hypothetical protein [Myxococcales bacterium]